MKLTEDERSLRDKARRIYQSALRLKKIIRPKECSSCGKKGRIFGHHHNYKKPLKVLWVCNKCHGLLHTRYGVKAQDLPRVTVIVDKGLKHKFVVKCAIMGYKAQDVLHQFVVDFCDKKNMYEQ